MAMSFFVPLNISDWRPEPNGGKGYFVCPALRMPGARAVGIRYDDRIVPADFYDIRGRRVVWKGGVPPGGMMLELRLGGRLLSAREALLTLVLGVVLGGAAAVHHAKIQSVVEGIAMIGTSYAASAHDG